MTEDDDDEYVYYELDNAFFRAWRDKENPDNFWPVFWVLGKNGWVVFKGDRIKPMMFGNRIPLSKVDFS